MTQLTDLNTGVVDKTIGDNLSAAEVNAIVDRVDVNATDAESRIDALETATPAYADDITATFGDSNELTIQHTTGGESQVFSSASMIIQGTAGELRNGDDEAVLSWDDNNVALYYNDAVRLSTTNDGVSIAGECVIPDNEYFASGNSDDLRFQYLSAGVGQIYIDEPLRIRATEIQGWNPLLSKRMFTFVANGAFNLYHDNNKVLESTSTTTVNVPTTLTVGGVDVSRGLGTISQTTTGTPDTNDYIDIQLIDSDLTDSPYEVEVVLKEFSHASNMTGLFPEIGLLDTSGNLFQVGAGAGELDASIRTYCRRRYYPVSTGTTTDAELNSSISTGDALAAGHATSGIATTSAAMISAKFRVLQRNASGATRPQVIFAELLYGDATGNLERHDITMTFRSRTAANLNTIGGIRIGHLSLPNTTTAISVKEPHGGV